MMMSEIELMVRGGSVVTPDGVKRVDFGVAGGAIVRMGPDLSDDAQVTLDVTGRYVFPGIMDGHVRFQEPGRVEWEGLAAGSAALAAGGGTAFFDLPLNSEPPVLDAARLREKRVLGEEKSCVDFGLWGGLTSGNFDKLAGLRDAGAMGLVAWMAVGGGGVAGSLAVDEKALREGMKRAARLGLIVAVHGESDGLGEGRATGLQAAGKRDAGAWSAARPREGELAAIRLALELAGETGCALHILRVSCPEAVALVDEARAQRVDATVETCPHYLLLNERDVARLGVIAKSAPPIRDESRRVALWAELRAGRVHTVGSDHSPVPPEMKSGADFFESWTGVAGVQHGASLLFSECAATAEQDLPRLAAVLARNVARRFRLDGRKGLLAEGRDADFCVIDYGSPRAIVADELWTRHRSSLYVGRKTRARVTDTYVRGQAVLSAGRLVNLATAGRFLRPQ